MSRLLLSLLVCSGLTACSHESAPVTTPTATAPVAPMISTTSGAAATTAADPQTAQQIFVQRILPIFQSKNPSSCTECHLSGVHLQDYILPSQEATFANLVAAGLIDAKRPDESKILKFIQRTPPGSPLINQKVREQEYAAFREWIIAAVAQPDLLNVAADGQPIGPQAPIESIRHARRDQVLASFVDNIWHEVGRCAACHSPDRNQKQVAEHGEQVSWIVLNDPQATLDRMLNADLINATEPEKSLLLQKPTLQVEHGGGQKAVAGDRTYKQFRRFIDDYAQMAHGGYATAAEIPQPSDEVSYITEIWLKLTGVPAKYDKQLLQVDLYRATDSGWSTERVATSDRLIFGPQNLWQHSLSLIAPRDSAAAKEIASLKLPPGKYLAKIYVDQTGKLQQDYSAELDASDLVGEVEVTSKWPAGYGKMTTIAFPSSPQE
ncbi:hypothetical protein LOC68_13195 [Blastopirellula sp. JC732]|uniref:Cytochrome c domain-containing protein n=1 Tax=Blastopirellula sediminis TaxID=2894196 RepID=A0A9X1SK40_9BACT|nr:hypothetical protein [Blastopirellula sediminis]MCC9607353.1 hypothetical protein [Blastopirellula sediminis]MCC9629354.1 hypothetical protein [Blastopirellula sediminis]